MVKDVLLSTVSTSQPVVNHCRLRAIIISDYNLLSVFCHPDAILILLAMEINGGHFSGVITEDTILLNLKTRRTLSFVD